MTCTSPVHSRDKELEVSRTLNPGLNKTTMFNFSELCVIENQGSIVGVLRKTQTLLTHCGQKLSSLLRSEYLRCMLTIDSFHR